MENTTTIALSRLMAQQRALEVTAGNIANASTPGYRAERTQFADWLVREPSSAEPRGGRTLIYTQDRATWREQREGALTQTGNPLDLAISGPDAWFTVQTPGGTRLTRAGHFTLSAAGQIVDADGNALLDTAGQPISLAPSDSRVTVGRDGTISTENGQVGRLGLVRPDTTQGMQGEGGRLYALPAGDATQPAPATAAVVQGMVEESNVQPITELTGMMDQQREFQFVSQFVQGEADRQQSAIDKILQKRS